MTKISVIVSRYKDFPDLSDMHNVISQIKQIGFDANLIIYDKHQNKSDTYKFVPNIGRENYGWFDYILSTWEHPDNFYVFAHPCSMSERVDKFEKFIHLCRNSIDAVKTGKSFSTPGQSFMMKASPTYSRKDLHLGGSVANLDDVKNQTFVKTNFNNLSEWWSARTNGAEFLPQTPVHGMCGASAKSLHSWGKEFHQSMMNDIIDGGENGEISHFLERTMVSIAAGKN